MKKFVIAIFVSLILIVCSSNTGVEAQEKPYILSKYFKVLDQANPDSIPDDAVMLFVQVGESGGFLKTEEGYRLTISDVAPQVIYFSDRPYRIVGHMTASDWASGMWEDESVNFKNDPPNAVLTIFDESNEANEIAVVLHKAKYIAEKGTMQYEVVVTGDYLEELEGQEQQKYAGIPEAFGNASLFIDRVHLGKWLKKTADKVVDTAKTAANKEVDKVKDTKVGQAVTQVVNTATQVADMLDPVQLVKNSKEVDQFISEGNRGIQKFVSDEGKTAIQFVTKEGKKLVIYGEDAERWADKTAEEIYHDFINIRDKVKDKVKDELKIAAKKIDIGNWEEKAEKDAVMLVSEAMKAGGELGESLGGPFGKQMGEQMGQRIGEAVVEKVTSIATGGGKDDSGGIDIAQMTFASAKAATKALNANLGISNHDIAKAIAYKTIDNQQDKILSTIAGVVPSDIHYGARPSGTTSVLDEGSNIEKINSEFIEDVKSLLTKQIEENLNSGKPVEGSFSQIGDEIESAISDMLTKIQEGS